MRKGQLLPRRLMPLSTERDWVDPKAVDQAPGQRGLTLSEEDLPRARASWGEELRTPEVATEIRLP